MANEIGAAVIPVTFDVSAAERRRAERASSFTATIRTQLDRAGLQAQLRAATAGQGIDVRASQSSLRALNNQVRQTLQRAATQSPFRVALAFGPRAGGALARAQIFRDLGVSLLPQIPAGGLRAAGFGGAAAFGLGALGLGAVGFGAGAFALTALTEDIRILQQRMQEFAGTQAEGNRAFRRLVEISSVSGQSIAGLGDFNQRLLQVYEGHANQVQRAGNIVEAVALAFRIEGTRAIEAQPLLFQLQQGLRQGQLGGRELRTLFERSPVLSQLLEDAAGQAGFRSARAAGAAGFFTRDRIESVFSEALPQLRERSEAFVQTLGQAGTRIANELQLIGLALAGGGIATATVDFVNSIADAARGVRVFTEELVGANVDERNERRRQRERELFGEELTNARRVSGIARATERARAVPLPEPTLDPFRFVAARPVSGIARTRAEQVEALPQFEVRVPPGLLAEQTSRFTEGLNAPLDNYISAWTRVHNDAASQVEEINARIRDIRVDRERAEGDRGLAEAARALGTRLAEESAQQFPIGGRIPVDQVPLAPPSLAQLEGLQANVQAEQQAQEFEARIESLGQTFAEAGLNFATFEDSFTGFISNIARSIARFTLQQGTDQLGQGLAGFIGGIIQNQTVNNFNSEVPSGIDQLNAGTNALLVQPQSTLGT